MFNNFNSQYKIFLMVWEKIEIVWETEQQGAENAERDQSFIHWFTFQITTNRQH